MLRGTRRSRMLIVLATTAAAVTGLAGAPAPAQVPDPPVVNAVDAFGPGQVAYVDCDGVTQIESFLDGGVLLEIDREPDGELTVPVSYSGSLADDLVDPVGEVVFGTDGETFGFVDFTLDAFEPGDLTVTVEPGPDHTVGPDGVVTIEVLDEPELLADCGDDLGSPPDGDDRQTIAVGEAPDPIGFFEDFDDDGDDGTDEVTVGVVQYGDGTEYRYQEGGLQAAPEGFSTTVISGALPPGLAYAADVWTGTATTPGTYDFDVRLCVDESSFVGDTPVTDAERSLARAQLARAIPDTICFGSVDVRIVVEPAAATTTPAAPAAPIATAARFTG